jgi:hypothetical protein
MFAGRDRQERHALMFTMRGSDINDIDLRIVNQGLVTGVDAGNVHLTGKGSGPFDRSASHRDCTLVGITMDSSHKIIGDITWREYTPT